MIDKDYDQLKEFERARNNPISKFISARKWWHYVLFFGAICLIIFLMYEDSLKAKFNTNEKTDIINALNNYHLNQTYVKLIMQKVNLSGSVNYTLIVFMILLFLIVIYILMNLKPIKPMDYRIVIKRVKYELEKSTGYGQIFPTGTRFEVGPDAKELGVGTLGLQERIPTKWVTKVLVHLPNHTVRAFLGFVDAYDGYFKGLVEVRKDDLNKEYNDVKVWKPREIWSMGEGWAKKNPYEK